MRYFTTLLCYILLVFTHAFTQRFSYGTPVVSGSNAIIEEERGATWEELVHERTLYSAQFKDAKGNTKGVFSKKPIHYKNNEGKWVPINPALNPTEPGVWRGQNQAFPTALFSNGSYSISLDEKGTSARMGLDRRVNGQWYPLAIRDGQVHKGGCDIPLGPYTQQLLFMEDRVKSNLLVSAPVNLGEEAYFITTERIELPDGFALQYEPHPVIKDEAITIRGSRSPLFIDGMAYGADIIIVHSETKTPCGKIFAPLAFDNAMKYQQGLMHFKPLAEANTYELTVAISAAWMNDSERVYPITIDPLVGGPTAVWGGGYMNSCLAPAYNIDSLQATIPGGVTVTGLYVTASFYADPWAAATMNQGVMYFSTTCGSSQTFTVTGPTALTAGTAYLDSFNMMSPLVCCIPESCTPSSFYVRYHLGRYSYGTGCNITYIRYDPFTTLWPFKVVVYGKTPEPYGSEWYATQTPKCSNDCEVEVRAYARYGVAPYTFTHPWTNDTVVIGTNTGCGAGSTNHLFNLTIPNCAVYCDSNFKLLYITPPVITDACGTLITSIPFETIPIKPASNIELQYDSVVCSGDAVNIQLNACFSNGTAYYYGEGQNGQGSFSLSPEAENSPVVLTYNAYAQGDGCNSDTTLFQITVNSNPNAAFSVAPIPVVAGVEATVQDQSTSPASVIQQWAWTLDDSLVNLSPQWSNLFITPGNQTLCLAVQDAVGCVDTLCSPLIVVPAEIQTPNIITPNGDGKNETLAFQYLEFYPANELKILNRWGTLIYEQSGYANTWSGDGFTDGVYFFVLTLKEKNQTYSGFFHLVR
ncbi:MAG: gliding motility-associated C-terminal domain-containing protein [Crocinitomicaceae bacterium]